MMQGLVGFVFFLLVFFWFLLLLVSVFLKYQRHKKAPGNKRLQIFPIKRVFLKKNKFSKTNICIYSQKSQGSFAEQVHFLIADQLAIKYWILPSLLLHEVLQPFSIRLWNGWNVTEHCEIYTFIKRLPGQKYATAGEDVQSHVRLENQEKKIDVFITLDKKLRRANLRR